MLGSTYVSVPPLGNAPFSFQVRHLCAELRFPGQALAGCQKVSTRNAHTKWACGVLAGVRANSTPADRSLTEPPKESRVQGGAALLASAPQMSQLRRS